MWHDKKDTPVCRGLVAVFKGLGGAILLVLATYALSAWYLDTFRKKAEYVGSADELTENFDLIVLRQDDSYSDAHVPLRFVSKWVKSIEISLEDQNAESERAFLEDLCALLTNLTGLEIRLDKGAETITVNIVKDSDEFRTTFKHLVGRDPRASTPTKPCKNAGKASTRPTPRNRNTPSPAARPASPGSASKGCGKRTRR